MTDQAQSTGLNASDVTQATAAKTAAHKKSAAKRKPAKKAAKKTTAKKKPAKKAAAKKTARKQPTGDSRSVIPREIAADYHRDKEVKTVSGNASVDCNDDVAAKLRGWSLAKVYTAVAKQIKEPEASLKKKYGHLNVGMQRMNLGNRLRGYLNAQ